MMNGTYDEYHHSICDGMIFEAEKCCYSLYFFGSILENEVSPSNIGELKIFQLPNLEQFDGVIIAPNTMPSFKMIDYFKDILPLDKGIPIVSMGLKMDGAYNIDIRDNGCMEAIVRHFVQDHGYSVINYISGPLENNDSIERMNAYKKVLEEHGIPIDEKRIFYGNFNRELGRQAVIQFLNSDIPFPQAIICANDSMALGAYAELIRHGLRVPEDVALSGYDFIREAEYSSPQFTSVISPLYDMGKKAVQIISNVVSGKEQAHFYLFDAKTVLSRSCGCSGLSSVDIRTVNNELVKRFDELRIYSLISSSMMRLLSGDYSMADISKKLTELIQILGFRQLYFCIDNNSMSMDMAQSGGYPEQMELFLGYVDGRYIHNTTFRTEDILPHLDNNDRSDIVFAPLFHNEHTFGYLALDYQHAEIFMSNILLQNIRLALENLRIQNVLKEYAITLEELSLRDPLTGVYNRRGLENQSKLLIGEANADKKLLSVVFVDLDGLKKINDNFGHAAGDDAIQIIARVLQQCAHSTDIVARIGGDEFVNIGFVNNEESLRSHVFSLESRLKLFNEHSQKPYPVNASFGWCLKQPEDDLDLMEMIKLADARLYEAKYARSHCV